jgi:hypothetical protein
MHANTQALGRNYMTVDLISITHVRDAEHGDCFRVNINWHDGAYAYVLHDTKEGAVSHVNSLGWGVKA